MKLVRLVIATIALSAGISSFSLGNQNPDTAGGTEPPKIIVEGHPEQIPLSTYNGGGPVGFTPVNGGAANHLPPEAEQALDASQISPPLQPIGRPNVQTLGSVLWPVAAAVVLEHMLTVLREEWRQMPARLYGVYFEGYTVLMCSAQGCNQPQ